MSVLIFSQAVPANAFYSPKLNEEASTIRQHVQLSKKNHGVASWWEFEEKQQKLDKQKKANEKAKKEGRTINEGYQGVFVKAVKEIVTDDLTTSFWDGLSLLIKKWIRSDKQGTITNCLRDDIWEAQALMEEVFNELMKASAFSDVENSTLLWNDFQYLHAAINSDGGTTVNNKFVKGLKYNYSDTNYWFPQGQNLYVNCPNGDFTQAWQDLDRALESFSNLGGESLVLGNFGAIKEIAKKRAITRAQQWIKANQITLTVGGKQGANPRSLFNGPGLGGLAADFKTELGYVKTFGEEVFVNTYKEATKDIEEARSLASIAQDNETAFKARDKAVRQMETALRFNLSLKNVADNSLKQIDSILFETNGHIEDTYSSKTTPENAKKFCEKLVSILKKQCKNKSVKIPTCN